MAKAGQFGAVTIATNMAGRGTDIKLDSRSKEAGGLYVIGTERSESRRVDNQLRGRSGRQGRSGIVFKIFYFVWKMTCCVYLVPKNIFPSFENLGIKDGMPIEHRNAVPFRRKSAEKGRGEPFCFSKSLT